LPIPVLIADDEEAPRAQLMQALRSVGSDFAPVLECANGVDAWDLFLEHEPAVCFLDVRMPGLTGIEVAQRIGTQARIVFVTAHADHALAAFDAGAIDYLLKPVEPARLAQTLERLRERLARGSAPADGLQALLDSLAREVRRPATLEVIQAGVGKEVRLVRVEDVVYFEADARYTRVVHAGGEVLVRTPLKDLIAQLDAAVFWQVHRSVIVNHRHVVAAVRGDDGSMHLTLRDRTERLPVSRHFQHLFRGQ
jgi:DNA-binding LytR/AlgR family response regulator